MQITSMTFEEWAIEQHILTNHFYDSELELPYKYHLLKSVIAGRQFKHLLPAYTLMIDGKPTPPSLKVWEHIVEPALWGHDLIEDARASYKAILERSNIQTAEICRAVTNYGRGRNRDERMPDFVYQDIVNTEFATFVKLCDRIANIRHSWEFQNRMFNVYKKEHEHFKKMLFKDLNLQPMWDLIDTLLKPELMP